MPALIDVTNFPPTGIWFSSAAVMVLHIESYWSCTASCSVVLHPSWLAARTKSIALKRHGRSFALNRALYSIHSIVQAFLAVELELNFLFFNFRPDSFWRHRGHPVQSRTAGACLELFTANRYSRMVSPDYLWLFNLRTLRPLFSCRRYKNDTLVVPTKDMIEILAENGFSLLKIYKPKIVQLGSYSCSDKTRQFGQANFRVSSKTSFTRVSQSAIKAPILYYSGTCCSRVHEIGKRCWRWQTSPTMHRLWISHSYGSLEKG